MRYESLKSLMMSRRSVRNYKNQIVEREIIEKILDTSATAPNDLGSSGIRWE